MLKSSERIGSSGSRRDVAAEPVRPRRMESFRFAFPLGQLDEV